MKNKSFLQEELEKMFKSRYKLRIINKKNFCNKDEEIGITYSPVAIEKINDNYYVAVLVNDYSEERINKRRFFEFYGFTKNGEANFFGEICDNNLTKNDLSNYINQIAKSCENIQSEEIELAFSM